MALSWTLFYAHVTVMLPPSSAWAHVTQEWKIVSAGHALLPLARSHGLDRGRKEWQTTLSWRQRGTRVRQRALRRRRSTG